MAFGNRPRTWLNVPFAEKEEAKQAGARWDPLARRWFVTGAPDETLVGRWLTGGSPVESMPADGGEQEAPLSLARWLSFAEDAIRWAYPEVAKVVAEVAEINGRGSSGHVYFDLTENNEAGIPHAKIRAMLWAGRASVVLGAFRASTGGVPERGMRLLLSLRASFDAKWGFSAEIMDIDPSWTLGDMERRRQEIRRRLVAEELNELNGELLAPVDFTRVAVIAPEGAAGLGDFRRDADRLASAGLCAFDYLTPRFQGEVSAAEILAAVTAFVARHARDPYDALVIVRGGGAKADLAWLDDFALAAGVCLAPLPVLTGIGHERDRGILDEVANQAFDTPSKVIGHIAGCIVTATIQAENAWRAVVSDSVLSLQTAETAAQSALVGIGQTAVAMLGTASASVAHLLATILAGATGSLAQASSKADGLFAEIVGASPDRLLERGWAVITAPVHGEVLTASVWNGLPSGTPVTVRFGDGVGHAHKEN